MPPSVGTDTKLLIISHDCDIVNPSFEAEPFVELLVVRPQPSEARNGAFFKGKNPRKLQLVAEAPGQSRLYEIDIHEKLRIDRQILQRGAPDITVRFNPDDVRLIARWAARRYDRPSFPSAFVNRTNVVRKKLLKKLERDGEDVLYVLVGFETVEELPDNQPYRILLRIVADPETCEDDEKEQRALSVSSELRKLLAQCDGIAVEDADIANSAEMTLYEYKHLRRWDFDYLSPEDDVGSE
ncbi:MAG: hypothetical protein ACRD20_00720 [Terriglobales bacterium]